MSKAGALEVQDLWRGYGSTQVLQSVNLHVAPGVLSAVLGLSGCGKTTLLRVIAGFERAQRGRVALSGQVLDDGHSYIPPERRGIGYVPQEGALFPHLDVQANVGFGLSRAERRDGTIIQQGSPAEIYGAPVDARLAGFLGDANLIEATFVDGSAHTPLGTLELRGGASKTSTATSGVVVVRPEQLRVSVHVEDGALSGVVEQCRYYGHDALMRIRTDASAGVPLLLARVRGEQALAIGTAVAVTATGVVSPLDTIDGRAQHPPPEHVVGEPAA